MSLHRRLMVLAVASSLACNALIAIDGYRPCKDTECAAGDAGATDATSNDGADPCLGSKLADGGCGPSKLLAGVNAPTGMASDGTTLYFGYGDSIGYCATSGCKGIPSVLVRKTNESVSSSLLLDTFAHSLIFGTSVFAQSGTLYKTMATAMPTSASSFAVSPRTPGVIIACGDNTCWIDRPQSGGAPSVFTCPTANCSNPVELFKFGMFDAAAGLGSDGTNVYAATTVTTDAGMTLEPIVRCSLSGCNQQPTPIAYVNYVHGMATYGDYLYFTANSSQPSGSVARCKMPDCAKFIPEILADKLTAPWDIAVDATGVYWTSSSGLGAIQMCPPGSCKNAMVTIATDQVNPQLITLDDTRVFWVNPITATTAADIMWMAKPR